MKTNFTHAEWCFIYFTLSQKANSHIKIKAPKTCQIFGVADADVQTIICGENGALINCLTKPSTVLLNITERTVPKTTDMITTIKQERQSGYFKWAIWTCYERSCHIINRRKMRKQTFGKFSMTRCANGYRVVNLRWHIYNAPFLKFQKFGRVYTAIWRCTTHGSNMIPFNMREKWFDTPLISKSIKNV